MKEIFTINLGFSGNFSSSYFWQIQDMYEHEYSFHESLFVQTSQGYFPRMLGIDKKESLSFPIVAGSEEQVLWGGKIQKIQQDSSSEEKWTDLLTGMISRRNLVPVYQDESPAEEIEEKIRWFSEVSNKLQGIHALQDMAFSQTTLISLRILNDSYPKIPMMLFSMDFKYTTEEAIMLCNTEEFSNLLHVPCTECSDKVWFSRLGVALDAISYNYRLGLGQDMRSVLQNDLFCDSKGNSAGLILNGASLTPPGENYKEIEFLRGRHNEKILTPLIFPETPPDVTLAKLTVGQGLADFYSSFTALPTFSTNIDDLREAQHYLKHLTDQYSNPAVNCD